MSQPPKDHEIVILGSHYAGLGTAHYLLRHIIPSLSAANLATRYHVTIVAPNTEFFNSVTAPRYLVGKDLIASSKMFLSIPDVLKKEYSEEQYSLVQGKAIAMDAEKRIITIGFYGGASQELSYRTLVIATGTFSNSGLWQVNDNQDVTKDQFSSIQTALPKARTVLVVGGGTVGVETAGEIAANYPNVEITIISGTERLLPRLLLANSKKAEKQLNAMGVDVIHKLRVTSSSKGANNTTTVVFSDGSQKTIDLFIDATGGKPNTSFLPTAWLNAKGYVVNDDKTLRTDTPGVYAIGDVASYSTGSIIDIHFAIAPLSTSIGIDLAAQIQKSTLFKQKIFSPLKNTQFVPIGPNGGVGQILGWQLPSWFIWLLKSRTFFADKAGEAVRGQEYLKP
ncbi:hypothetical protein IFR05_002181 [Cadophora sp. M221]|nr:hypothetical protein IFR05_002181 [Cadophora sp. M221]